MELLEGVETIRKDIPSFNVGDTVVVEVKVVEGDRERVQPFRGVVIRKRGRGSGETFTVRRVAHGEGVERIFPIQSPLIHRIEVLRRGQVRRAKLYYLRKLKGRKGRIQAASPEDFRNSGRPPKEAKVETPAASEERKESLDEK